MVSKRKIFSGAFFGAVADKTNVHGIVHVIPAIKMLWSLCRGVQQVAQRGHGSVVQIRRPQPESVERMVRVAEGFAEMFEAIVRIRGVKQVLISGQLGGIGVEPVAIGSDQFDRRDLAHEFAGEVLPVGPWQLAQCWR